MSNAAVSEVGSNFSDGIVGDRQQMFDPIYLSINDKMLDRNSFYFRKYIGQVRVAEVHFFSDVFGIVLIKHALLGDHEIHDMLDLLSDNFLSRSDKIEARLFGFLFQQLKRTRGHIGVADADFARMHRLQLDPCCFTEVYEPGLALGVFHISDVKFHRVFRFARGATESWLKAANPGPILLKFDIHCQSMQTRSAITTRPEYFDRYIDLCDEVTLSDALNASTSELCKSDMQAWRALGDNVYAPGKWTIKEIIQHLIDCERIFCFRALSIARGETERLPGFEEDAYASASDANRRSLDEVVDELKRLHLSTKDLFDSFSKEMLARKAPSFKGEYSVADIGFIIAGHQRWHLKVIDERYLGR